MLKEISTPYQNFTNAVMSGTNTITSAVTNISYKDSVAIQLQFTGTPVGTFSVQVSIDYRPQPSQTGDTGSPPSNGTWVPLTLSAVPVAAGSADQITIDMSQVAAPFVRVQYTNTSGTGTLNGFISAKSLG
jgi:hypothetical protein